jgi:hypothetical protein
LLITQVTLAPGPPANEVPFLTELWPPAPTSVTVIPLAYAGIGRRNGFVVSAGRYVIEVLAVVLSGVKLMGTLFCVHCADIPPVTDAGNMPFDRVATINAEEVASDVPATAETNAALTFEIDAITSDAATNVGPEVPAVPKLLA